MKKRTGAFFLIMLLLAVLLPAQDSPLFDFFFLQNDPFITTSETNLSGVVGAGARAFGMGGAFIAVADDATAASWNPGGLGQLEKPEFSLVARYQSTRDMSPAGGDTLNYMYGAMDQRSNNQGFDFLSATYPIRIGRFKLVPQISYQRAISFDMDSRMNDVQSLIYNISSPNSDETVSFSGSFHDTQRFSGGLDVISLSLGSRFLKRFNVGVSFNFWRNGYHGERTQEFRGETFSEDGSGEGQYIEFDRSQSLSMELNGFNVNVGVLVDLSEKLKLGAVFKSSFRGDMEFEVGFEGEDPEDGEDNGNREPPPLPPRREDDAVLRWPVTFGVGISYRPIDPLTISFDVTATEWSDAVLEDFLIRTDGPDGSEPVWEKTDVYFPTLQPVADDIEDDGIWTQRDTVQIRLGVEYVLIGENHLLPLRLGFFSDTQYYSDSSNGPVTFYGVTVGAGYKRGRFSIDMAVLYEFGSYLYDNLDFSATNFSEVRSYLSVSYGF